MKKLQRSQYDMLLRIITVVLRFSSAWAKLRLFASQFTQLQESVARIKMLTKDQELLRAGVKPERDQYLALLVQAVLVTSGQIQAWATVTKDIKLRTRFAFSKTKLSASLLELPGIAREVHTVATANLDALTEAGTTKESLDQLNDLIETYETLAGAPRNAVKTRATITRILQRELRGAMELMKEFFDPAMRQFEDKDPEFFEAYRSARLRFSPGSRAQLDENGQPVAKWRIEEAAKKEAKAEARAESTANARTKAKAAKAKRGAQADTMPLAG